MAALQCEICGGKLIGKPGGIFECDSCGMEYSTEWAKAKIQEIKGTVKVEGTVEVKGTVKLDGPIKVDNQPDKKNFLKRGWNLLEDRNWKQADEYFDKVLDIDPECGEAYAGKFCADMKFRYILEMSYASSRLDGVAFNRLYIQALQYGDEDLQWTLKENLDTGLKVRDFRRAQDLLTKKRSIADLEEAKHLIEKTGDLSKEQDMLQRCDEAIAEIKLENKNSIMYRRACAHMQEESVKGWKAAIPLFEELGEWKDSESKAEICRHKIEVKKRKDKLEDEELKLMEEKRNTSIFSRKRRQEIDERLAQIDEELKRLR